MVKECKWITDEGWTYCPNSPNILRRVVGHDDDDCPIIEEISIEELQKRKRNRRCDPDNQQH